VVDVQNADGAQKDLYVRCRLQGYGCREAAERAGYEGGRPSPGARRLWKVVKQVRGCDTAERSIASRQKIDRLEYQLQQARLEMRAVQAVRAEITGK